MPINAKHPEYDARALDWLVLSDCYLGERVVKGKGQDYLPATSGQEADGMGTTQTGYKNYQAYKERAIFPDFVREAVEGLVGIMHREPARITLPKKLEGMLESATPFGEPLLALLRRINESQLLYGRCGLLVDVPDGLGPTEALPYIAHYSAMRVINWDVGTRDRGRVYLQVVVLDESEEERQPDLSWLLKRKYRVLVMSDAVPSPDGSPSPIKPQYWTALHQEDDSWVSLTGMDFTVPSVAGKALEAIPFVFVNACDSAPSVDQPPLMGMAHMALAVYRGEADYRNALHLQGQDTLVIIGANPSTDSKEGLDSTRVGPGAVIDLPMGGKAEYIGVDGTGLSEQRSSLENDRQMAAQMGARVLDTVGAADASGEALRVRVAASTATLSSIANTGADALRQALRRAAEWVGADPEEVVVEPNLDFADDTASGEDLLKLILAKRQGAPLSNESIHRWMRLRDLTEMDYEEEAALSEEEAVELGPESTGRGGDDPAQE